MTAAKLREFLTIMHEFGVFECSVDGMSFKIGSPMARPLQDETPNDKKTRIADEMRRLLHEQELDENWSSS